MFPFRVGAAGRAIVFALSLAVAASKASALPHTVADTIVARADTSESPSAVPSATAERLAVSRPATDAVDAPGSRKDRACGRSPANATLRQAGAAAAFIGGNAALYGYFKRAWWSGERADHFFFRPDWDENFRDQDKFGHIYGGYHLARIGGAILRGACVSPTPATLWSAAYAASFQLQIEIWDGLYEKYGFSYPDLLANTAGTALAVVHDIYPRTRAVKPTMSYSRSPALRNADNIPGELRPTLDYSGQTYWFSADVNGLLPATRGYWPSFLRISAGHSITDWIDPRTGANLRARRRILLSVDLDAEKLPGDNRIWRTVKRQLGFIHFPSPALQIAPTFEGIAWYR